jgi:hypothetical protein
VERSSTRRIFTKGQHQAIVDDEIFERVQAQFRENSFNRGNRSTKQTWWPAEGIDSLSRL